MEGAFNVDNYMPCRSLFKIVVTFYYTQEMCLNLFFVICYISIIAELLFIMFFYYFKAIKMLNTIKAKAFII